MESSRCNTNRSTTCMRTAGLSSARSTWARVLRTWGSPASGFKPSRAFRRTPALESRATALSRASRTSPESARLFKRSMDSTRTAGLSSRAAASSSFWMSRSPVGPETTRRRVSSKAIWTRPELSGSTERTVENTSPAGESKEAGRPAPVNRAAKKPTATSATAPTGVRYRLNPESVAARASRNRVQGPLAGFSERGAAALDGGQQIGAAGLEQHGRALRPAPVERRRHGALPLHFARAGGTDVQVLFQAVFLFRHQF